MKRIVICDNIGYCSGVRNAIWKSVLSLSAEKPTVIYGNLIHNERVLREISYNHIQLINDIGAIPMNSRVIIPAHGITKDDEMRILRITQDVWDMTCPVVVRFRRQLAVLSRDGYQIVLFGKRQHPEIVGAVSHAVPGHVHIIEKVEDLDPIDWNQPKWAVMSQTTANQDVFENVIQILQAKHLPELAIFRTLCPTVSDRQNSVELLSRESDVVLVVGDAKSSNTLSLYNKSHLINQDTYLVESNHPYQFEHLVLGKIHKADQVGFLAGTSTPFYCIDEILEKISLACSPEKKFQPVLVLFGPTAVGKTDCAENLAGILQTEIINCDSMQIYKHMTIGTAKPTFPHPTIPYHMVDILEPNQRFSVAAFRNAADPIIADILKRGKMPIISGGSYLYLTSLIDGLFEMQQAETCMMIRKQLEAQCESRGLDSLYSVLQEVDPEAFSRISSQDKKRIIRALEVYYTTQQPISLLQKEKTIPLPYFFIKIGLVRNPEDLYLRIHERTEQMVKNGLKEEIRFLADQGYRKDIEFIKAHGYRELMEANEGTVTWEDALYTMEKNTRHYVKRQLSWLRQRSDFHLINLNLGNTEEAVKVILTLVQDCTAWLGS